MLLLSAAAWAGGWSPCPAEQTTHCGPEASGAGEECCPLADRTIVPVGSAEPETLRMGRLLVGRTEVTRGEYLAVVGSGPRLWECSARAAARLPRVGFRLVRAR